MVRKNIIKIALFFIVGIVAGVICVNLFLRSRFLDENSDNIVFATKKMYVTDNEKVKAYKFNAFSGMKCIYESDKQPYAMKVYDLLKGLVILEVYNENDKLEYSLKYIDGSKCTLIKKENATKIPYIYVADDFLLINSQLLENTYLYSYFPSTDKTELIDSKNYSVTEDGYTGDAIYFCGGSDNTVYYQVVSAEDESFDESTKAKLVKYDLVNRSVVETFPLNDKILHVSGNKDSYIVSEYSYKEPLRCSGKIYHKNRQVCLLSEVESGKDIVFSKILKDRLIFANSEKLWCYNITENKLGSISISGKSVYFLQDGIITHEGTAFIKTDYSEISWTWKTV